MTRPRLHLPALLLGACAAAPPPGAADHAFPDDFCGTWRGECSLLGPEGVRQRFAMALAIAPTERDSWTFHITYGEGDRAQLRAYELLPVAPEEGHWAVDEHNGIVLDSYVRGRTLYSSFAVGGVRLLARYEGRGDELLVEIATTAVDPVRTTGAGEGPEQRVEAFALKGVQRGVLRRAP